MHLVVHKFTFVLSPLVCKEVEPCTLVLSVDKVALVVRPILPFERAFSVLLAFAKLALIDRSFLLKNLLSIAVLLVHIPVTLVPCSASVLKHSIAVSPVVLPFSVVHVTVCVQDAAIPLLLAYSEFALVLTPISVKQDTEPVRLAF